MSADVLLDRFRTVPAIVPPILREIARRRAIGELTDGGFAVRVERLEREELEPRDFELLIRESPTGSVSFLIKARRSGQIYEVIDCPLKDVLDGKFDGASGR